MSESRFYICKHCKNIIGVIHDEGGNLCCCDDKMTHLKPRNENEWEDKHAPKVKKTQNGIQVDVGEIMHPMTDSHGISWIYLQTDRGGQRKCLEPNTKPTANFSLNNEKPVAAYAYCNMHGLWKTDIN